MRGLGAGILNNAGSGQDRPSAADGYADALLRFENFERYTAQSNATKTGRRAELPPRARLSRVLLQPNAPWAVRQ